MRILFFLSVCFLFLAYQFASLVYCQQIPIQFDNLSIQDGLSHSTVYKIIQDKNGFIWIGTQNGLNKFDGYTFTTFKNIPFDTLSLPDNWIRTIIESDDGFIWIGTFNGGISKFNPKKESFINFKNDPNNKSSLFDDRILSLYEDDSSNIWIGTSRSLDKFNVKTKIFHHFLTNELSIIPNGACNSIYQDAEGYIWAATWGAGLFKITQSGNVLQNYLFTFNDKPTSNKLKTLYEDKDNFLWIGTNENGLIKFNKQTGEYVVYNHSPTNSFSLSHNFVLSIMEDSKKNLWVGTQSGGLNLFNRKSEIFYSYQNLPYDEYSLRNNWVSSIYQTRSGTIWVGTDKGLGKFISGNQVFKNLQHFENVQNSLSSNDIHSVCEDSKGNIWIGTWRSGLNKFNPKTNEITKYFFNPKDKFSLPHNTVFAIYEDKQENLWIGSYNGLAKYIPQKDHFKVYRNIASDSNSIGFNNITAICQDSFGNLWIGTWNGGLHRMDIRTEKFTKYQKDQYSSKGLRDMVINCIYEDKNYNLFVGTASGGLNIYDRNNDSFTSFVNDPKNKNSISNNSISSIAETEDGMIWIGTLAGGINKFDPNTKIFTHFYSILGLTDNSIMSLLPDSLGNIWFTTSTTISYLNRNTLNVITFDKKDGVGNSQFTRVAAKGKDGKFIFGGKNGITYFYPTETREQIIEPNIAILSIKVFGVKKEINRDPAGNEIIELNYEDDEFAIDFAVLDYFRPDKIKYGYMLEGFHQNWEISNKHRTAYFTHLDPGKYKFFIKATFHNNNWFYRKSPLIIIIHPPIWERWWFILIFSLLVGLLIYSIYKYRLNQLLRMEKLRTSIAADLHDEIASNLSGIAMFGKIIQEENIKENCDNKPSNQLLDRIICLSQESVVSIREIIWAIDPKNETVYDLLIKINDMIITSCIANNIQLNFDIPSSEMLPSKNLLPNQRRDLWMLLKETLNNSIKHSNCSQIFVIATYDGKILRIIIRDDGQGFDINKEYKGKGMYTIKKRAKDLNAKLELTSNITDGSTTILTLEI